MFRQTIGDTAQFAIEWGMLKALESTSQMAIGFFVIHVGGKPYGVQKDDATLMACSYDTVKLRVSKKGKHVVPFASMAGLPIAKSIVSAIYGMNENVETDYFGLTEGQFRGVLQQSEVLWAPDGDEAFDDGGHVVQIDSGQSVRLIAFVNSRHSHELSTTLNDVMVGKDVFYGALESWLSEFESVRDVMLNSQHSEKR